MMKAADIAGEAAYDVETIRTDFPILYREVYGKPLVYLDNGASAQKPRSVLDAIDYAYTMEYANVHRGLHYLSNAATARYEDARETRAPLPQCAERRGDHLHGQRHRAASISSPAASAWTSSDGDEIVHLDHGAPLQHRALAFPPRAQGLRAQVGADRRRRHVPASTSSRSC